MSNEEIKVLTDEALTVGDLAKRLNVCRHTVVRWMEKKGLPFVRIGKKRITTVPVFEKWTQRKEN